MGRILGVSRELKFARVAGCGLAALALFTLLLPCVQSQESGKSASLRGMVHNSQGKPVADATVRLQNRDSAQAQTARTDSQGNYNFAGIDGGVYILRAEGTGYGDAEVPSLFLGPKETKTVDLTLGPAKSPESSSSSSQAPKFFDQPQFTVAGVTDTTSLGGHGSDTVVRTREEIARATVALGKGSPASSPRLSSGSSAAELSLRDKVEREPRNFDTNHDLGKALIENGKAREAIPYLERAAEIKPGDHENAYDLALANANAGNYAQARDSAQALLIHSDTAELHHLLGDVQERLGNALDAVHEYQRAAELDPRESYLFDWGSELLLHHAPEPALEVFAKGNRLFTRSVRMLIGLGAASFAQGANEQAVQRICEASDLEPDNAIPYLFLGRMQRAETRTSNEVVEKLHRFATLQPQNAEANYYYALSLWNSRKSPQDGAASGQIESLLNNAIRLDPKFGTAHLQLGKLHAENRDLPKAISEYQQAIRADPQLEEAHYRLAQAYRQIGENDKEKAELKIYEQMMRETALRTERERHEIRQFVYALRDQIPEVQ